jgi:UDP-glucose 4-epimerase
MSEYGYLSLVEGYSVNKAIEACEKATGRRPGAPARLVASSQKLMKSFAEKRNIRWNKSFESVWKWQRRKG